ncbi:MAG: 2-dehydropantoate 2-reductase [Granulosicoccus sp.]|nr:2-dehydropantoate 2-reductase [Granulosicoccus sp.]
MRIAILGAGAVGSWVGGHLALHGNDVHLLTTNSAHINAIRKNGLQLRKADKSRRIEVPTSNPSEFKDTVDLVIVLTKTFQLESALESIEGILQGNTAVLTLQNGLGNGEIVARYAGAANTWVGLTMLPVDRIEPGVVEGKGEGGTWFGPFHGNSGALAEDIENAFKPADIDVTYDPNVLVRIWQKVAFNAGMNAVCALTHSTPGGINNSEFALEFVKSVAAEVAAVAEAEHVAIDLEAVYNTIDYACNNHGSHLPSMLQDLMNGRRTEVDALNGAIVSRAGCAGIEAPLNKLLTGMLKLAEQGHRRDSST